MRESKRVIKKEKKREKRSGKKDLRGMNQVQGRMSHC
jgi:hypothetical protein